MLNYLYFPLLLVYVVKSGYFFNKWRSKVFTYEFESVRYHKDDHNLMHILMHETNLKQMEEIKWAEL